MEKCVCCEGTGKVACKTCNGEGKVTCSVCGGNGRDISVCPTCTKGYVPDPRSMDDEPTLKCPDCHGEWQKDVGPCKECNGTGHVPCSHCDGTGKEVCSLCKGTGDIDVEAMCRKLICEAPCEGCFEYEDMRLREAMLTADMVPAIQDAADRGVGLAAFVMSELYRWGLNVEGGLKVEADSAKEKEYMRKGAEAGDPCAQCDYGISCLSPKKEDQERAYQWIVKAGENGNLEALYWLAVDGYIYGAFGRDRNLVKSLECFNKILKAKETGKFSFGGICSDVAEGYVKFLPNIINNDTQAMLALAKWLDEYQDGEEGEGYWSKRAAHLNGESIKDAFYWKLEAAQAGNGDAMLEVAKIYWEGYDVFDCREKKVDKVKANEWYGKAASQGDAKTLVKLGQRLLTGDGISKDPCQALVYLYRAAEQGNVAAVQKLGTMYLDGEYVEKNREHALGLYVRAAKSGDSSALYSVGTYYLNVKKDQEEAKRLFQLAAEQGHKAATEEFAKIPFSVKASTKMPSGIKGVPDKSSLPKYLKKDYEQAVAGKPALKAGKTVKKTERDSTKKRWKFVVLGLLFGAFGVHFAYARRWFLFLLLWAAFITGGVMSGGNSKSENLTVDTEAAEVTKSDESPKPESNSPLGSIGFAIWGLLWIGGTLFIKKDGKGNRM